MNGTAHHDSATNGVVDELELDALVVGAGFAGCYLLHRLRKENFSVKIVEAGTGLGGIWHWNSYPGARVDSQYPIYSYNLPEVYKDWRWTEQYPGSAELRAYFKHADKQLDLSKDVIFGTKVVAAKFDADQDKWRIECDSGLRITARFFLCCIGFAARRHFPDWPGLNTFKGTICHSSFWPEGGFDVRGNKVSVVGTGATGIQIAQTTARDAAQLTVLQRTPNLCCPMKQAKVTPEQALADLEDLPGIMERRLKIYSGFLYETQKDINTFDHTPEEREAFYSKLWDMGGFRMLAKNYCDMMRDPVANREAYNFWAKKTRERIPDPVKRDILAPLEPPHAFAGKRISLEQDFYEQMSKDHVTIIDLRANPVSHVVSEGIVTSDNTLHEFDIIAIATGFDSFTGGLKDVNPVGLNDLALCDKWKDGTYTAFGITVADFPNFFFLYGPQAPTAYANGPSITEPQGDWVVDVMKRMRSMGKTRINATVEKEREWKEEVNRLHKGTLRDTVTGSWYMVRIASSKFGDLFRVRDADEYQGGNIPGKPREPLNYAGGIPMYLQKIRGAVENDFEGFVLS